MSDHERHTLEIEGIIKAVVFHNEENGYTIMHLELSDQSSATVRGRLPAAVAGETIRATGAWVDDRRFGRQFEADQIHALPPQSNEGITRFLASGLIDGIGPAYAKRIVAAFGTDTFRVIETESQRLEEVPGIGKARRLRIKESWKRQKSVRDIMIFLHLHGISTARALRLYKIYGEEAVNVLRANPYQLARDIPGVGFRTADKIAQQMGQAVESPRRLAAGILHALNQAERQGQSALPRSALVVEAAALLEISPDEVELALNPLILEGQIIVETSDGDPLVFTPELYEAEVSVVDHVVKLLNSPPTLPALDGSAAIAWFERHHSLRLSSEQSAAILAAASTRFSIITGGPGVGKTTILRALIEILSAKKVHCVLCAPTGRAAKRLAESTGHEAFTLHRALEFQPNGSFARNRHRPLAGDFFIIDEASMIDLRLMAYLMEAIPPEGSVLLVGDADQLPSVGAGNILSDLINSEVVPVSRLREIHRQASSSRIIEAAHAINLGQLPPLDNPSDSDFFFLERQSPESIIETIQHLVSERIPKHFGLHPRDDIQVLTPMNRQSLGTRALNAQLQAALNPPSELKFEIERFGTIYRQGDKVIQIRNNYDKEVFNGDIGSIVEITTEPTSIYVSFEGHPRVHYEPGELDELLLAYAVTIHKSQGSEFPAVVIPLASQHFLMLQRNLVYTAITRGKRLVILVGDRRSLEQAVRQSNRQERYSGLCARLRKASASSQAPNQGS